MKNFKTLSLLAALLFSTSLFLFSCSSQNSEQSKNVGNQSADSTYVVDIIAADFAFGMPSEIPSGWVTFRMENRGKHEHHGIIEKFPDSLGFDRLSKMVYATFGQEDRKKIQQVKEMKLYNDGGPSIISPGETSETTFFMEPGLYVFTCFLPASDGKYHAQKGMRRVFQVTNNKSGATQPEGTIGLTLSNFAIEINDPVSAGEQVFNVEFKDNHNVHLARLEEGQQLDSLVRYMNKAQTPSPFTFLGGAENEPPGSQAFFKADLEPGRYALVTYKRAAIGMFNEFTVPVSGAYDVNTASKERPVVNVELGTDAIKIPESFPSGIYTITISNTTSSKQRYLLFMLNEGYTKVDVAAHTEKFLINRSPGIEETPWPATPLKFSLLDPGGKDELKLNLKGGKLLIFGPFPDIKPEQWSWSAEKGYLISADG